MHLSKDLQKQLKKIGSSIKLSKTIDGESPSNYEFYQPIKERNFRTDFGATINEYSIIFFDRTEKRNHEICHLRGKFSSIEKLAESIKMWIEDEETVENIAGKFEELEMFHFDEFENPNPQIEERWKYVKNRILTIPNFGKIRIGKIDISKCLKRRKEKKNGKTIFRLQAIIG